MFQIGDKVKFINPYPNEAGQIYTVVWCDRERTMIQGHIEGWIIQSTTIVYTEELESVRTYREFPTMEIPAMFQVYPWEDASYHNDLTAHSETTKGFLDNRIICVWVYPEDKSSYDFMDAPKFAITITDNDGEYMGEEYDPNNPYADFKADSVEELQAELNRLFVKYGKVQS